MTKHSFGSFASSPAGAAMDFFANSKNSTRFCDTTAWNTWLWADYLEASVFVYAGVRVLRRLAMDGTPTYTALCSCPLGEETLSALAKASCERKEKLCLFPLAEEEKDKLIALFPHAVAEYSPDWRDYLYDLTALATFRGKKYNGQRNHLNRFRALYPDGGCVPLEDANRQDALSFLNEFYGEGELSPAVAAERKKVTALISSHPFSGQDNLYGFLVHNGEKVVALAVAEVVGDTLYVHVEKALRQCQGAYQAIVSGVASAFCDQGILYLNREEDDGNEGLRTSKLSYHPSSLLSKWRVTLKTEK